MHAHNGMGNPKIIIKFCLDIRNLLVEMKNRAVGATDTLKEKRE
jgi:hypothetical protein